MDCFGHILGVRIGAHVACISTPKILQSMKMEVGRELPVSAVTGTFAPFLQHYIGVTKVLITLAAASITFGGNPNKNTIILAAKLILAFSILYGVLFCAFMLYAYDEYCQNVRAYTRFWYSTVEAFGFSTLLSFIVGYLFWASNLGY